MFVILPSHIEVILPVAIFTWLFFFIPRFKWKKIPRYLPVFVLLVCTMALLAMQTVIPNEIPAYEEGTVLLRGQTWDMTLEPDMITQIGQISNYYVISSTSIMLNTDNDVRFYLVDENLPETRHNEQNLTESDNWVYVRLPYLYTEENVVANWSLYFENPSHTGRVNVLLDWNPIEDTLILESWSVRYWPYMPIRILITLWVFFSLGFIANTKSTSSVDQLSYQYIRFLGYFGVWVAIFGGMFLWSLAGLPLFIGLGLLPIAFFWVWFAEHTFSINMKEKMSTLESQENSNM